MVQIITQKGTSLCFFICLQCFGLAFAQNLPPPDSTYISEGRGNIHGNVIDADNGEGLAYVNLRLNDSILDVSTQDGSFQFSDLTPGSYQIKATFVGYAEQVEQVEVSGGQQTDVVITLSTSSITMNTVVITASRKATAASNVPASVHVLSSSQLQEKSVTTFDQAFADIPGLAVTRSSGANVQSFSIRGASEVAGGGVGNRTLLLIDGRPSLSPESGGALWNLVPVNSIEQIEIVKGAYSALYGSSAMGGVVNVITKTPKQKPQTNLHFNYGFHNKTPRGSGYEGYNDFYSLEAGHSRKFNKFGYLVDAAIKHNDGHREKSSFDLYNFFGKFTYTIDKDRYVRFSANLNRINNDSPATWLSPFKAHRVAPHRKDDFQNREEFNADIQYNAFPKAGLKYSSRFYYYQNTSHYTYDNDPDNDSTNVNLGKQRVVESNSKVQRLGNLSQINLYSDFKHYLIAGTDLKWDRVIGLPDSINFGDHQVLNTAAFVQDEIQLHPKFSISLGLRYDFYHILYEKIQNHNISPKLAFIYDFGKTLKIKGLFAQAFRDPPIAERYIKFVQASGLRFQPNPGLQSEKLNASFELGADLRINSTATLNTSFFYNHYKNLIAFQQLSDPLEPLLFRVINLNKAVMQGCEISFSQRFKKHLRYQLNYTYLDAKDVSKNRINDVLAYKPRHSFNLIANVDFGRFSLNTNGRYRSQVEEVSIYPGSEPEAVFVWNANINYSFFEKHVVYLSIKNINNAQYEELERYRMPGRSYSTGVRLNF